MIFPKLKKADILNKAKKRLYISAYGFEERSLGWTNFQLKKAKVQMLSDAFIIKYSNSKGKNKITELRENLNDLGVTYPNEFQYDNYSIDDIESVLEEKLVKAISNYEEIILDITPLTKFLILIFLCKLQSFEGTLRIVYSEAEEYSPNQTDFQKWKESMKSIATFPSKGFGTILRAKCLSSIRMQGQPVTLIAFTSFNEQLVRYLLGSISPYRLLFINGKPPRKEYSWREFATQFIHRKLITEYHEENQLDNRHLLKRTCSTLNYKETINVLNTIHQEYSNFERIIIAATGSKMQTVGLFFIKQMFSDIHIEYPTPDSYYVKGFSSGIRNIHEIKILNFSSFIIELSDNKFD
jgi:hypothetical protein